MKKQIITIVMLLTGSAWTMTQLPEGEFKGRGFWKDLLGKQGTYNVLTKIKSNSLATVYYYGNEEKKVDFQFKSDKDGFFDVVVNEVKIGSGYCLNVQCHYSILVGNMKLEETLAFWQNNLYKIGSKTIEGKTVAWEEALDSK